MDMLCRIQVLLRLDDLLRHQELPLRRPRLEVHRRPRALLPHLGRGQTRGPPHPRVHAGDKAQVGRLDWKQFFQTEV